MKRRRTWCEGRRYRGKGEMDGDDSLWPLLKGITERKYKKTDPLTTEDSKHAMSGYYQKKQKTKTSLKNLQNGQTRIFITSFCFNKGDKKTVVQGSNAELN